MNATNGEIVMTHPFAHFIPAAPQASQFNQAVRGGYGEILRIGEIPAKELISRFQPCLPETFVSLDNKRRGDALNLDLYGYCSDQEVELIQVRHFFQRAAKHFGNTHKDYVLVGYNELTQEPFRHPVSHATIHAAIRKSPSDPTAAIRAAQAWMWEVKAEKLSACLRQGDVLIVPESRAPNGERHAEGSAIVGGSHRIDASEMVVVSERKVFARDPMLTHLKGQHHPVTAPTGRWYSVRLAREAHAWDWSVRLGD